MERRAVPREGVTFYLKCLLFSYMITGLLLMLLALLLYKLRLSEQIVSIGIIVIYVAASFFAGFVTGKKRKEKKFLWGLLMGTAYFLILTVVSFAVNRSVDDLAGNFVTAFAICACSGMLGGMLS
ncbi:MAG: TIGR04086 family membrane protein [Lachnospiraceae bacterium]|nr:TIGR04086 family membrane protein [Lachnospiraceae bacterium]